MPHSSPQKLTPGAFARAKTFIGRAQPLEQALFSFYFEDHDPDPVIAALRPFQLSDGGFSGLEADIGFSESSVLSTCRALRILHDVSAPAGHSLVQQALDYLLASYDPALDAWPIIPPHDNSAPHAPWWHYSGDFAEKWQRFEDNPRPDALGWLYVFPCAKTEALRRHVSLTTLNRLRSVERTADMHGIICHVRLYPAPNLPKELKQELERVLPKWIDQGVERDPGKWTGYCLRPLGVVPLADFPWRHLLAQAIEHNLDFLIQNQAPDGSWHPPWSWGSFFPEAWPAAKLKWQAILTLDALLSLRSYGRIG